MKRTIQFSFIFLLCFTSLLAQTSKQDLTLADKSMENKDYYNAFVNYKKLADAYPNNIEYLYKAAEASRLFNSFKNATTYYEQVLAHPDNNSYPLTGFWLGQVKQSQGDYNAASAAYKAYKSEKGSEDVYYSSLADKEIKACEWALQNVKNPVKGTTLTRLGESINSAYSDFGPAINGDDLFFSSLRFDNLNNKTYPSRKISNILKSKKLSTANALDFTNPSWAGKSVAHTAFNKDKSKVYFTVCDNINEYDKRCDLYSASVDKSGAWSEAVKLSDFINKPGVTQTQPNIGYNATINKEVLYFASNREGGKGGLDLWYVVIDGSGNYSEPMNLASLNTAQDDACPFYHSASKTLYYSSKGHLGMGGYDVFQVREQSNGWGQIKNLGSPINSSLDDVYFIRAEKGTEGYLASNRTGSLLLDDASEACCLDIFKTNILPCEINLKSFVYDADTQKDLLGVTVKLIDTKDPSGKPIMVTNDITNLNEFPIECDREYRLEASKPGYLPETITFNTGKPGENIEITKKLYLKPESIKLDVLTFYKQTGESLNCCDVTLFDLDDVNSKPITLRNCESNLNQFSVTRCHKYRIVASKDGYVNGQNEFTVDCKATGKLTEKVYLDKYLQSLLPVCLYFDNDIPHPGRTVTTTRLSYSQTYFPYYARKNYYVSRNSHGNSIISNSSTNSSVTNCSCAGSSNPIYKFNQNVSPKIIHRLGTNPEFGSLHGMSSSEVLEKFKKAAKESKRDKDFLDQAFQGIGYSSFDQVSVGAISEVELARGTVGNIGYSKDHYTTFVKMDNEPKDLLAFKFVGPNGCSLHFMKTCGNHFFFCENQSTTIAPENLNSSSGCFVNGTDIGSFFEYNVKAGKDKLDLFIDRLAIDLAAGKKYIIFVKGHTSPLAQNDYNLNLGQRRIQSIKNEFATCRGGILAKYIKSGILVIREKSYGEDEAPVGIPFDPKDPRSIYRVDASSERRVEIIEIQE